VSADHQEAISAAIDTVKQGDIDGLIPSQIVGRLERLRGSFEHVAGDAEAEVATEVAVVESDVEARLAEAKTNKDVAAIAEELGVTIPADVKKVADKVKFLEEHLAAKVEGEDAGASESDPPTE
jgi:hypothetical protein